MEIIEIIIDLENFSNVHYSRRATIPKSSTRAGINKFPRKTRKFEIEQHPFGEPVFKPPLVGGRGGSRIYTDLRGKFVNVVARSKNSFTRFNKLTREREVLHECVALSLNERKILSLSQLGHRSLLKRMVRLDGREIYPSDRERERESTEARSTTYANTSTTCSEKFRRAALPSVERLSQQHQLSDRWSTHSTGSVMHIFSYEHFHSGLYAIFSSILITPPRVFHRRTRQLAAPANAEGETRVSSSQQIPNFYSNISSDFKFFAQISKVFVILLYMECCVI